MGRQEISACSVEILSFAGGDMDRPLEAESAEQPSSQCFGLSLKVRTHRSAVSVRTGEPP